MMTVDLDKDDLINLLKGIEPNYDVMEHPLIKSHGSFAGGFLDRWIWNSHSSLNKCNEAEILGMYYVCKNSWDI